MAFTDVDRRLVKQCVSRAPGGWEAFIDRFLGLFLHVIKHTASARSVELTSDDVDDLCSEIMLVLLQNDFAVLRHFRGKSSLSTYLVVIARRVVVRELIQRKQAEALGHVAAHNSAMDAAGNVSEVQRIENSDEVKLLMGVLGSSDSEIIRKYHLEGRSYRQISEEMGISENSIGPTLKRARDRLREMNVRSRA